MTARIVLLIAVILAAAVAAALLYGSRSWRSGTRAMRARLEAARLPIESAGYDPTETDTLPVPVRRFFRAVLTEGQPMIAAAYVEHEGTFNMSDSGEQWKPFISTQRVIAHRPGFDWDARIAMFPGLKVHVRDAYIAGEGILFAKVAGLIPVMDMERDRELARGELMRWFAEAAWYPTALLPGRGVRWTAVDDSTADATMRDGDIELTMRFRFGADGLIESVRAESRGYANLDGTVEQLPWEGRWTDCERREGILVPTRGEVGWIFPEGYRPYWRGRIARIEYELAR
ncbi:MAG: hypothetical protein PHQ19_00340 [Candidatus Krumholzibacteria bacterium]|nr:hypothetical protein [Candidatus Krumholzibacteria bacterium]